MGSSRDYVQRELEKQDALRRGYERELARLPEGKLKMVASKGKQYYCRIGNGARIYIGDSEKGEVRALKKRRFLETALKNIRANQILMKNYLDQYCSVNPADIMKSLPKTYQSEETFGLADFMDAEKWEAAPYDRSDKRPEHLSHKTIKGDMVRSKSEAIIANILYNMKIPYHYEEKLWLGRELVVPDFKIAVRSESRFKLLEHCGMMGKSGYRNDFRWKLEHYLMEGYLPWRDVFFTFDDKNGNIDTAAISDMIEHYFL